MSESYLTSQTDQRTLAAMVDRILDDLNRPDLQAEALEYIQDAIRHFQRKPWLWNEIDNTAVATYANGTNYPQGSIIQVSISGTLYAMCALVTGLSSASSTPAWPSTVFTPPAAGQIPPPAPGTAGTIVDNNITWANVGLWSSNAWTQLSTVYGINQYIPPLDYVAPKRIEITIPNQRYELNGISIDELRNRDVVRIGGSQVGAVVAYPTDVAWWQQQFYIWAYPVSFFPLTLLYRTAPPIIGAMANANFWTQQFEAAVRAEASRRICLQQLHDEQAAEDYKVIRDDEEKSWRSQAIAQRGIGGIPASDW